MPPPPKKTFELVVVILGDFDKAIDFFDGGQPEGGLSPSPLQNAKHVVAVPHMDSQNEHSALYGDML